tara:strand:- start:48379 stop:48888 length:510 start_codon:yes stop_codon:yes gene_type:complete
MIRVNLEKNNRDWQIIEDNNIVIKATRPKWYSSEIRFFFNGKTYQIKRKSFWSSSSNIFQGGMEIGSIKYSLKKGYFVNIYNTGKTYSLSQENKGGMWKINREYTMIDNNLRKIIKIKYSKKNFRKEIMEIEKLEIEDSNYDLIMYGLDLMRRIQMSESAAAASVVPYG